MKHDDDHPNTSRASKQGYHQVEAIPQEEITLPAIREESHPPTERNPPRMVDPEEKKSNLYPILYPPTMNTKDKYFFKFIGLKKPVATNKTQPNVPSTSTKEIDTQTDRQTQYIKRKRTKLQRTAQESDRQNEVACVINDETQLSSTYISTPLQRDVGITVMSQSEQSTYTTESE